MSTQDDGFAFVEELFQILTRLVQIFILLMDGVDINKMAIQREVREVLDRLKQESIVREENGSFFFFNEDEMQVQTLIDGMNPALDEQFETFKEDFLHPMTQLRQRHDLGSKQVSIGLKVEEGVLSKWRF